MMLNVSEKSCLSDAEGDLLNKAVQQQQKMIVVKDLGQFPVWAAKKPHAYLVHDSNKSVMGLPVIESQVTGT